MATHEPKDAPATDPDHVQETLCIGKFNILLSGAFATITFTHARPKPGALVDHGITDYESVVRARIVTTAENMLAMRDLLIRIYNDKPQGSVGPSTTGGILN
ncbi:hypothetical protein [Rhodoplanes sp. SY1]|uniref:hypothetical protein n=1 Tax=Rhodoplanes sp. SY1 TaxID=3166646 RepID=UPI0038B5E99E